MRTENTFTEEILNIDYHLKRLIVKALNKAPSVKTAALLLGCSERMLHLKKRQYNIIRLKDKTWAEIIQINRYEEQEHQKQAIAAN